VNFIYDGALSDSNPETKQDDAVLLFSDDGRQRLSAPGASKVAPRSMSRRSARPRVFVLDDADSGSSSDSDDDAAAIRSRLRPPSQPRYADPSAAFRSAVAEPLAKLLPGASKDGRLDTIISTLFEALPEWQRRPPLSTAGAQISAGRSKPAPKGGVVKIDAPPDASFRRVTPPAGGPPHPFSKASAVAPVPAPPPTSFRSGQTAPASIQRIPLQLPAGAGQSTPQQPDEAFHPLAADARPAAPGRPTAIAAPPESTSEESAASADSQSGSATRVAEPFSPLPFAEPTDPTAIRAAPTDAGTEAVSTTSGCQKDE
jgi:hypothetical protein